MNGSFIHGGGVPWQQQLCNLIGHQLLPLASVLTPVFHKSSKVICILIKSVVEESFCILHVLAEEQN